MAAVVAVALAVAVVVAAAAAVAVAALAAVAAVALAAVAAAVPAEAAVAGPLGVVAVRPVVVGARDFAARIAVLLRFLASASLLVALPFDCCSFGVLPTSARVFAIARRLCEFFQWVHFPWFSLN